MISPTLSLLAVCCVTLFCGYTCRRRRQMMDSQGKTVAFFMIITVVGVTIIMSSYNGVIWTPFRMSGLSSGHSGVVSGIQEPVAQNNDVIMDKFHKEIDNDKPLQLHESKGEKGEGEKDMHGEEIDVEKETDQKKEENIDKKTGEDTKKEEAVVEDKGKEESDAIFYGIMFDAGSTGSRIHAFQFEKRGEGKPAKLLDELFEYNQRGLSSFQDNPKEGAESLRPMLDSAKKYIPESKWSSTPIALKATAGLRLLPQEKAKALLSAVRDLFAEYPYKAGNDSVQIMDGDDEGIFSWFTFNFLTGALGDPELMVGVMDLGGGSTQVTYVPIIAETIKNAPEDYLTDIDIFGKMVKLYSHSYLGLGLIAARFQTIGGIDKPNSEETNPDNFSSPCFAQSHSEVWDYQGKNYTVKGIQPDKGTRFESCYKQALRVVHEHKILTDKELQLKNFSIISYYYDKAEDAGLIDPKVGGTIKVKDYFEAAMKVCGENHRKPFLCLDLSYMSALLHEGFGFNKEKQLLLKKKIQGTEISWALGAMFQLFDSNPPPS